MTMICVVVSAAIRFLNAGGTGIVMSFIVRSVFIAVLILAGLTIGFLSGGPIGALLGAVLLAMVAGWVLIEWDEVVKELR